MRELGDVLLKFYTHPVVHVLHVVPVRFETLKNYDKYVRKPTKIGGVVLDTRSNHTNKYSNFNV